MKTSNEYQQAYPEYRDTPKAVIAAIAMSLALRLSEDDFEAASRLVRAEWQALHAAEIVPQRPKNK